MKRIIVFPFFFFACFLAQSQQLFFEDFFSEANGATTGTATGSAPVGERGWSINTGAGAPVAGSFDRRDYGGAGYERFTINQTGANEGIWSSNVVTIPAGKQVAVNIALITYNASATDYVRAYYKLNGGPEVMFGSAVGGNYVISEGASVVLSGSTVQIVVRGKENTTGGPVATPNMMRFDDVEIYAIRNLYSRTDAAWNVGTTWSLADAVGTTGGASCGCTPLDTDNVIIRAEDAVTIPAITAGGGNGTDGTTVSGAAEVVNVTVRSGGSLTFSAVETLNLMRGGGMNIAATGTLSSGANTTAQIVIPAAAQTSIVTDGTLTIGDFSINAAATVTFSGNGTFTTQDDFLVPAAATIVNNMTGTLIVTDDVVISASNVSITNNGTFTVTSDFGINVATNAGCTFTNAASKIFNVGSISPTNSNFILNNSGTINQSGDFPNGEIAASTGQLNNLATGTWNYSIANNSGVDTDVSTILNLSAVGNTFNYAASGNQNFIATTYHHLGIVGAGSKYLQANIDVNGDLLISGASNPSLSSNTRNIALAGNWSMLNSTTFTQGTGTTNVTFDGTANQTISAVAALTFNNLTINKASGNVLLSSTSPTVAGTLSLMAGGLSLSGNTLNITNTATTAITRTNGYIISETTGTPYSPVVWTIGTGTGSYVFPFATSGASYIPFTFNITAAGAGATGKVSVATYPTGAANTPFPSGVTHVKNATGANNSANTVDRFWIISPTGYAPNPTATITFTAAAAEIGTITTLRGQRWNGTNWDLPLAGATNTATTATVPGVTTFSPWAVSGNNSPLPVELKYFKAAIDGDAVKLDWETAQERNNDFFTVEKTVGLENFEEIIKRAGQGTTAELRHYSEVDSNPYFGRSYYRLKQTDFDGKFTYSNVQMIDYSGPQFAFLRAYPSPSKDRKITIEIKGLKEAKSIPIQIVNAQGQKVMEKTLEVKTPGSVKEEMVFDSSLPSGLYVIKAGNTLQLTQKIVVE